MLDPTTGEPDRTTSPAHVIARSREDRQLLLLMLLAAAILSNQIQHEVLYSVDGIVYAEVGKELARRPISQWALLTWNGIPFFEHPHLTPWLLAVSMTLFGVGTLQAILPILVLSVATVFLAYRLGCTLLDHRLGILTGTVLVLTPEFVRGSRNPMLEPALMFFVMLTVYSHLRATEPKRFTEGTLLASVSLALAILSKGPPALLAIAVILGFQCAARFIPGPFERWHLPVGRLAIHLVAMVVVTAAVVVLVDAWHRAEAGTSFLEQYASHQLRFTVVEGRGAAANDWSWYARTFLRYWPWWPLVVASLGLVVWKPDRVALPALVVGWLVTGGTYLGFTLMAHKAEWYIAIHYVGSSILAALSLRYVVSEEAVQRFYNAVVVVVVVPMLFLSAAVPALFLQYGRPFERFMEEAHAELGDGLEGERLADCVGLDPWKGRFFLSFYLGVIRAECSDDTARLEIIDTRTYTTEPGYRIAVSRQPFAILERPGTH